MTNKSSNQENTAKIKVQTMKGYKNTEVGVIPEEWSVDNLSEVIDFLDGQRRPIKANVRKSGIYPYYVHQALLIM